MPDRGAGIALRQRTTGKLLENCREYYREYYRETYCRKRVLTVPE